MQSSGHDQLAKHWTDSIAIILLWLWNRVLVKTPMGGSR